VTSGASFVTRNLALAFTLQDQQIAILVAGVLLYAFIWFATRNLSRVGKILARLAPLGLVLPAMIYLSSVSGSRMDVTSKAPRPAHTG
jgi:hypothetical protein